MGLRPGVNIKKGGPAGPPFENRCYFPVPVSVTFAVDALELMVRVDEYVLAAVGVNTTLTVQLLPEASGEAQGAPEIENGLEAVTELIERLEPEAPLFVIVNDFVNDLGLVTVPKASEVVEGFITGLTYFIPVPESVTLAAGVTGSLVLKVR